MRALTKIASLYLVSGLLWGGCVPAFAQGAAKNTGGVALSGFGAKSKEPVKIDANRLEVFDKENRAVYTGDVVLVQGNTIVRAESMTIFYVTSRAVSTSSPALEPAPAAPLAAQNSIRQIDFTGPVSLLSGTQSATANAMTYSASNETVTLTGNVVLADCENTQRGQRAVYDVKTGKARVEGRGGTGRVQGIFMVGGEDKKPKPQPGALRPTECPAKARN